MYSVFVEYFLRFLLLSLQQQRGAALEQGASGEAAKKSGQADPPKRHQNGLLGWARQHTLRTSRASNFRTTPTSLYTWHSVWESSPWTTKTHKNRDDCICVFVLSNHVSLGPRFSKRRRKYRNRRGPASTPPTECPSALLVPLSFRGAPRRPFYTRTIPVRLLGPARVCFSLACLGRCLLSVYARIPLLAVQSSRRATGSPAGPVFYNTYPHHVRHGSCCSM